MSGGRKNLYILLWSREDIKIEGEDLKTVIEDETQGAEIQVLNFEDLQEMELGDLKSFMARYSESSILIISSSEKAENMDFWKLGFIMGGVSVHGKNGGARIFGFVKGDRTKCFQKLSDMLSICRNEITIKRDIKSLMEDMGLIETGFNIEDWKAGKRSAGEGI